MNHLPSISIFRGKLAVGVSRRVHPRKLIHMEPRNDSYGRGISWFKPGDFWCPCYFSGVYNYFMWFQNSHGFFQAPPRLAGQLSETASQAPGSALRPALWVGPQGKVAWWSPNGEAFPVCVCVCGRFKHGKPILIRLNQPIWQKTCWTWESSIWIWGVNINKHDFHHLECYANVFLAYHDQEYQQYFAGNSWNLSTNWVRKDQRYSTASAP